MGTWACPSTREHMDRIEDLMTRPLPASTAIASLSGLIGDDELSDLVAMAEEKDPAADVRALVALPLDLWSNWMTEDQFTHRHGPAVVEWMRLMAQTYADFDPSGLVDLKIRNDEDAKAVMRHHFGPGDYEIVPGGAPGIRVARSADRADIYRIEPVWGIVLKAPAELRDAVDARFPSRSAGSGRGFPR